jgi:hypothetical protein
MLSPCTLVYFAKSISRVTGNRVLKLTMSSKFGKLLVIPGLSPASVQELNELLRLWIVEGIALQVHHPGQRVLAIIHRSDRYLAFQSVS